VPDAIVYSDSLPSYNALTVAGLRHRRINHSKLFAAGKNHSNGLENFWNQSQRHLRKFNGVPKAHFPLCLKGGEWRFNHPNPQTQLTQLSRAAPNKIIGWRRHLPIFSRPDFAFSKQKIAIFVDGCFWHGCPKHPRECLYRVIFGRACRAPWRGQNKCLKVRNGQDLRPELSSKGLTIQHFQLSWKQYHIPIADGVE